MYDAKSRDAKKRASQDEYRKDPSGKIDKWGIESSARAQGGTRGLDTQNRTALSVQVGNPRKRELSGSVGAHKGKK